MDIENISSVSFTVFVVNKIQLSLHQELQKTTFSYFFFKYTTVINMLSIFFYFVFITIVMMSSKLT
jgi:hypothetical protein